MSAYVAMHVWEFLAMCAGCFLAGVVVASLVASRSASRRSERAMRQAVALVSRDLGARHVAI